MEFVKFSKNVVTKNVKVEQKLSSGWLIEPFNLFLGIKVTKYSCWKNLMLPEKYQKINLRLIMKPRKDQKTHNDVKFH